MQPTSRSRKGMSLESAAPPLPLATTPKDNYVTENLGSLKQCIPPPTKMLTYNGRNREVGREREGRRERMATERVERGLFALGKVLQIPSLEADVLVEPEGTIG